MILGYFLLSMFLISIAAGFLGSIVGIGGGLIIIPVLTIFFGVDIHFAIAASIVSIIATSSGAAATYVRDRMTNLRIGMFLELGTTAGAIAGAGVAAYANSLALEIVFALVMVVSLIPLVRKFGEDIPAKPELLGLSKRLKLQGAYAESDGSTVEYNAARPGVGLLSMVGAGFLSALLGIGGGTFKVLSMDLAMKLPMKVSTTTSNFMIGVTAAASAGIYFVRGDVNPAIVAPVALGVLIGAYFGAKALPKAKNPTIRRLFAIVLVAGAVEMVLRALGV